MRRLSSRTLAGSFAALAVVGLAVTAPRAGAAPAPAAEAARSAHGEQPAFEVIAHRGASGYRPEHTLAAYELAIGMGADVIEPDLVATRDGQLVVRHENEISGTTDVADHPEFADRKRTKVIDGTEVTGWFTEDFTLAELKTLRAKERLPQLRQENTLYDGLYEIPTLQEVIDLARRASRETGRTIGIAPEMKHPTYFRGIGLGLEERVAQVLRANNWDDRNDPVVVQSFEAGALQRLNRMVQVDLAMLLSNSGRPYDFVVSGDPRSYADLATPRGLDWIAGFADAIGPEQRLIAPWGADGTVGAPTTLVADAHREKLEVYVWTVRNENNFLPPSLRSGSDPAAYGDVWPLYELYVEQGVDGVFADQPDTAVAARELFAG
ncbi:glycerophosphodiester phosphodiesterase [Allostreptomyces psammosilenae]|uniref:glycerophosphodiester phosphodiesterase n=1 Tax=Allostreptomyces psammosilenae TaxID=1892865 RepID=A0A852ZTC8_9ACTN|nr:glycerophosphodiester phosphodiesterase [Allostreptomyces psammosilenae]NYI04044.1 glycerophosphoryl diester phosphodiesterase [Allostreptomyces psammosilenae]